jgi:hypothetical protein
MLGLLIVIVLFLFYKIQRKICAQYILSRKLIIPLICFVLSIGGSIHINDIICNKSDQLISYPSDKDAIISQTDESESYSSFRVTSNLKETAAISIQKKQLSKKEISEILLILNVPTLLFIIFIFIGNKNNKQTFLII